MTVNELIEELRKYPGDMLVLTRENLSEFGLVNLLIEESQVYLRTSLDGNPKNFISALSFIPAFDQEVYYESQKP